MEPDGDLFDLLEEQFMSNQENQGFSDGFERGQMDGHSEGQDLGQQEGARRGLELGYFYGYTMIIKQLLYPDKKHQHMTFSDRNQDNSNPMNGEGEHDLGDGKGKESSNDDEYIDIGAQELNRTVSRRERLLTELLKLIEDYPRSNETNCEEKLQTIRVKFRQAFGANGQSGTLFASKNEDTVG